MTPSPDHPVPEALAVRIEEASLNAWPALRQQFYHGWLLRYSRGFTRRANSVQSPFEGWRKAPAEAELLERIRYCENRYAREHQPTVFRITDLPGQDHLDRVLDARGYQRLAETRVLIRSLNHTPPAALDPGPSCRELPAIDDWLEHYARLAELPEPGRSLHGAILRGIPGRLGLWVTDGPQVQSCGLGVVEAELLGLFDLITAQDARRQGLAQALLAALLRWGQECGALHAYLQVVNDNAPAIRLYERAGFELAYRYWYRQSN